VRSEAGELVPRRKKAGGLLSTPTDTLIVVHGMSELLFLYALFKNTVFFFKL
jgi:hypothetical protein